MKIAGQYKFRKFLEKWKLIPLKIMILNIIGKQKLENLFKKLSFINQNFRTIYIFFYFLKTKILKIASKPIFNY